jgi:hypothetical protein
VSVGDDVMGYSLASIGNRRVTVSKDGRNVSVAMTDAVPTTIAATPANGRGQQQRGGRGGQGQGRGQGQGQGQGNAPAVRIFGGQGGDITIDAGRAQQLEQQLQQRIQRAQGQGGNQGNQGRGAQQPARPRPPGGG